MNWGTLKFQMKTLSSQTPGTCLHSTSLLPSSCLPRKCWGRQITPSHWCPSTGQEGGQTLSPPESLRGICPLCLCFFKWKMVLIMVSALPSYGKGSLEYHGGAEKRF